MFTNTLFNDISNVLERGSQLLQLVVAKGDVVSDVALVPSGIQSFSELRLGLLILFFFVEDATLCNKRFRSLRLHLLDEGFGMGHLFQFILDVYLQLQDFVCIIIRLDLLRHLQGFLVHASLEKTLSMIHLVLVNVREELC